MTRRQKLGPWQEAWVGTLEGNQFDQCRRFLCRKEGKSFSFCCLGIACEVAIENGIGLSVREADAPSICVYYNQHNGVLPPVIERLMRFRGKQGMLSTSHLPKKLAQECMREIDEGNSLAALNDRKKWDFKRIAAFARKYPEAVFTGPA